MNLRMIIINITIKILITIYIHTYEVDFIIILLYQTNFRININTIIYFFSLNIFHSI